MYMFGGFFGAPWGENDRKRMIAVHPQQNIGVDRDILCSCLPFVAEALKIGKASIVLVTHLLVDSRALTRIKSVVFDVVVILQSRVAA